MNLTLAEMQARAASNPSLVLVSCSKLPNGIDPQTGLDMFKHSYIGAPANYKLDCNPVEEVTGEIWAVLENLYYVAPTV